MAPLRRLPTALTAAMFSLTALSVTAGWQFASTTSLVVLNVRVTDSRGVHVPNLPQQAFTVFEDGKPQPLSLFLHEDAPVTVGLILDSSTSMWAIKDDLIASALAFARASHPDDELFAIAFNETRQPALPPSAPFTGDPAVLNEALGRVIQPRGQTALFDAIRAGLRYADRGSLPRQALVLVSDGGDNASTATLDEVIAETLTSNTVIYAVALADPLDRTASPDVLRRLARSSGGDVFAPRGVTDLTTAMERVADDIRQAYMLGYQTSGSRPGAYHELKVTVSSTARGGFRVRTREGYREAPTTPGDHDSR